MVNQCFRWRYLAHFTVRKARGALYYEYAIR